MTNFDRMTNEEAIKTIKVAIAEAEWNYPMNYAIAFEMAISALGKQILKKPTPHIVQPVEAPIKIGNGRWQKGTTVYKCPNCKEWVSKTYKHCPDCGQALDSNSDGSDTE